MVHGFFAVTVGESETAVAHGGFESEAVVLHVGRVRQQWHVVRVRVRQW